MKTDQRDVLFAARNASGIRCRFRIEDECFGDVVSLALDVVAGLEHAPCGFDLDRSELEDSRPLRGRLLALDVPLVIEDRVELLAIEADLIARVGAVLVDQGVCELSKRKGRLIEIREVAERAERLRPVGDRSAAWVRAIILIPIRGLRRTRSKDLVARLIGLPDASACIAELLGRIGQAAIGVALLRWPIERDECAPTEVVEPGERLFERFPRLHRHIVDPRRVDLWRGGVLRQRGPRCAKRDRHKTSNRHSPHRRPPAVKEY